MAEHGVPPVSIHGLRNTLHVAMEESSLRQLARQVDVSPTGLRQFLDGAAPYRPVRHKLKRWWEERGHLAPRTVPVELARLALADLVAPLPPAARHPTIREVLAVLAADHRRAEVVPPAWLPELCAEYGVQTPPDAA